MRKKMGETEIQISDELLALCLLTGLDTHGIHLEFFQKPRAEQD
tara:strand:- start:38 stop:169 length:132 start_codon:yes stop_codon:yes gene_type:complete